MHRILTATEYFDIIFSCERDGTLSSSIAVVVIIKTRLPRNLRSRQAPVLPITSVYQFEMLLLASMETTELTSLNKQGLFYFFLDHIAIHPKRGRGCTVSMSLS